MKLNAVQRLKASTATHETRTEIVARFQKMSAKIIAGYQSPLVDLVNSGAKDWDKVIGAFRNLAQTQVEFCLANGMPEDHEMVVQAKKDLASLDQQMDEYEAAVAKLNEKE